MQDKGFRKLETWQKAFGFALQVYRTTHVFPKEELYTLTQQLKHSAVSVSANIAEGYERQHRKEYIQFLAIAKGSLGEVETYLLLARELGYFHSDQYQLLEASRQEVARLLTGLIRSLRPTPVPPDYR